MFPPARTGVLTYDGWTTYAFAPVGGFSAGGWTTTILYLQPGDMTGVQQGSHFLLAATCPHLAVTEPGLMVERCVYVSVTAPAARLTAERLLVRTISTRD